MELKTQEQERKLRELEGKNIEHYSVLLSAWIKTRMERDKSLLTISVAAIGGLITILTAFTLHSILEIIFFAITGICFFITICSSLSIYKVNAEHIEEALKDASFNNVKLEKYDKISIRSFYMGCALFIVTGILSASIKLNNSMPTKKVTTEHSVKNNSLNGISNLLPTVMDKKSLNGIGNLKPSPSQESNQSQNSGQNNNTSHSNSSSSNNNKKK